VATADTKIKDDPRAFTGNYTTSVFFPGAYGFFRKQSIGKSPYSD
jgi:hypothetical protein